MYTTDTDILTKATHDFTTECKQFFGDRLVDIIMYGSTARGDNNILSDIDIMVIVDADDNFVKSTKTHLSKIASKIDTKYDYDIFISANIQNKLNFDTAINRYYDNVRKDGVSFYERQ